MIFLFCAAERGDEDRAFSDILYLYESMGMSL